MARNLGPADLLEYPREKLKGLLLEEGSAASHAAIVARALQIPCVGRLQGLRDRLTEGDQVIVDGETGVLVDYDAADAEGFERRLAEAVNAVAGDRERAAAMGAAGLERAKNEFSWRTIAQQTVDIYKGLI